MASRIEQHVRERVAHLAWCPQHVQVEAVRQNGTAPREDSIHGSRQARGEGFHAAGELLRAGGLYEHVHVVGLDGIMHEAEPPRSHAAAKLRSSSRTSRTVRSEGRPRRTFNVTWHGKRAASGARLRCGSRGLGPGLRPAPPDDRPNAESRGDRDRADDLPLLHDQKHDRCLCQIRSHAQLDLRDVLNLRSAKTTDHERRQGHDHPNCKWKLESRTRRHLPGRLSSALATWEMSRDVARVEPRRPRG